MSDEHAGPPEPSQAPEASGPPGSTESQSGAPGEPVPRGLLEWAPARPTDDGRGFILDPRGIGGDYAPDQLGRAHTATVLADSGQEYPAQFRPAGPGEPLEVRYPVSVIETKVPYDARPTRGLLDTDAQCADRGYAAVFRPLDPDDPAGQLGAPDAPDDDPDHGVGVESWWTAWFTETECAELAAAPSVRTVTWQTVHRPVGYPARRPAGGGGA